MVFPFGKTIALTPNWSPLVPSAHVPARPPRRPSAQRWRSLIYPFMTSLMNTFLSVGQAMPQAAAQPPKEGPIYSPQDLHFIYEYDDLTPHSRGEPPGGYDDGMKEDDETLQWLKGGGGGTVAALAGPDDPQTEANEDSQKSGESAAPTPKSQ